MVLPTMSTTPAPSSAPVSRTTTPQYVQHRMQTLHPIGVELHGLHVRHGGNRRLERVGALGRAREQRRRDDEGIGQGIVGERIERLAEPRIVAKLLQRLIGA